MTSVSNTPSKYLQVIQGPPAIGEKAAIPLENADGDPRLTGEQAICSLAWEGSKESDTEK